MSEQTIDRVAARAAAAGLELSSPVIAGSATYLQLLARWNSRINLTALPLGPALTDATIDKLIVEPLCGAALIPDGTASWFDLGSGGGSPALPLRLVYRSGSLTMVESRERKCAFLREAVRELNLARTHAVASRFEELRGVGIADLITIRAVRLDDETVARIAGWLRPSGVLMCFGAAINDPRFTTETVRPLPDGSALHLLHKVDR